MTLPKKGTRSLKLGGRDYRWKLGKVVSDGYANLVVETPEGKVWITEKKIGIDKQVTPDMVRLFIRDKLSEEGVRFFSIHSSNNGLLNLAEHRGWNDDVIALPVGLPVGTTLKDEDGVSWVAIRVVGRHHLVFNRSGAKEGTLLYYYPS